MSTKMLKLEQIWDGYVRGWYPKDKAAQRNMSPLRKQGNYSRYLDGEAFGKYRFDASRYVVYRDGGLNDPLEFQKFFSRYYVRQYDIVLLRVSNTGLKFRLVEEIDEEKQYVFGCNYIILRPKYSNLLKELESANWMGDRIEQVKKERELNSWFLMAVLSSSPMKERFSAMFGKRQFILLDELKSIDVPYPELPVRKRIALEFKAQYQAQTVSITNMLANQKIMNSLLFNNVGD